MKLFAIKAALFVLNRVYAFLVKQSVKRTGEVLLDEARSRVAEGKAKLEQYRDEVKDRTR